MNLFIPWPERGRVALDIETHDPELTKLGCGARRKGSFIAGISYAIEDGPAHYLPMRHEAGGNMDPQAVMFYIKDQAKYFKGEIVGANLDYDLDFLAENYIYFHPDVRFRDVLIADVLLCDLHRRYSLAAVAERHGVQGKFEDELLAKAKEMGLKKPKNNIWRLPASAVAEYAINDVTAPLAVLREQEVKIERRGLKDIWELETDVLPVVLAMKRRGVRIDLDKLDEVENWFYEQELICLEGTGLSSENINRPTAIEAALKPLGITLPRTPTGKPSVKRDILSGFDHEVTRKIVRAKKFNKLRTTFCKSIRTHVIGDRLHPTFRQAKSNIPGKDSDGGVGPGRLSSANPNIQQQPKPKKKEPEIAERWRQIYLPDEGGKWACLDYASQEPRWMVHFAAITNCPGAADMVARYRQDPWTDLHQATADIMGCERDKAKIIYLGLAYGMGGAKLCKSLGLPTVIRRGREYAGPQGRALINKYHAAVPFVRALDLKSQRAAEKRGYIKTAGGRQCCFPRFGSEYAYTYRALNRLIQGSSADQMKKAMVMAERAGHKVQLQVHDELDLTVSGERQTREVEEIMVTAMKLELPVCVEAALGDNWGQLKELE